MSFMSCSTANAKFQEKLQKCDGSPLPAGTKVATCDDLAGLSIADATDTIKGKVALNLGTSLPGDATNCTDALTACGLNALLTDPAAGGNAVINNVKALVPLATTTIPGLIEEATGEETRLGATDPNKDDRAVTPGSMSYALQTGKDYKIDVRTSAPDITAIYVNNKVGANSVLGTYAQVSDITGSTYTAGVYGVLAAGTANAPDITFTAANRGLVAAGVTTPSGKVTEGVEGTNYSTGDGTKYGVVGYSTSAGGTNIGVYGSANSGTTNWAGYFDGNTYLGTLSGLGTTNLVNLGAGRTVATMDGATDSIIWGRAGGADKGYLQFQSVGVNLNSLGSNNINLDAGTSGAINFLTAGNFRLTIDAAGASVFGGSVTATSYITSSDETLKENVEDIDAAKALQFRNGLKWKKYELFSEQQVEIMEEVTEEVQKTDAEGNPVVDADGNPVMETLTKQVGTGRYEVKRSSQGIKRGLIAQEVQALAASIGDFSDVVAVVGEYFTLDAQGYPVKDAQGKNIVNKRLGLDYDAVSFIVMCAEQSALIPA